MRRVLFALLAVLFSMPLLASEITPEAVITSMNEYREKAGLPPLRENPRLVKAADDRIHDMEDLGYWGHESPDGRAPFVWLRSEGYNYQYAGENLAAGFETNELLVSSWMESPGHRANILSPVYVDCGVAVLDGATTGRATGKSVVVLFGRPKLGEVPPAK